jgi:hypothetical protein
MSTWSAVQTGPHRDIKTLVKLEGQRRRIFSCDREGENRSPQGRI